MTQEDYIKIAGVLHNQMRRGLPEDSDIVSEFADMLQADNPRFDRERFFKTIFKEF